MLGAFRSSLHGDVVFCCGGGWPLHPPGMVEQGGKLGAKR